jgi:nucleoside-diphosphate-sugar epimerase
MRVLVTGSEGLIGSALCKLLVSRGHSCVGFDIISSGDILEPQAIREAGDACDAIVHCAALLGQPDQKSEAIFETNLQGTWNVLQSAAENDIHKVVFLSSVDVLGVFKGQKKPDFLPLDESHRCYPSTPYGTSKYLAENACNRVSTASGLSVVCLRPR